DALGKGSRSLACVSLNSTWTFKLSACWFATHREVDRAELTDDLLETRAQLRMTGGGLIGMTRKMPTLPPVKSLSSAQACRAKNASLPVAPLHPGMTN